MEGVILILMENRFNRIDIQDKVIEVIVEDIQGRGLEADSRVEIVANKYCLDYCFVGLNSKLPHLEFVGSFGKNGDGVGEGIGGNGVVASYNIDEYARRFES